MVDLKSSSFIAMIKVQLKLSFEASRALSSQLGIYTSSFYPAESLSKSDKDFLSRNSSLYLVVVDLEFLSRTYRVLQMSKT